MSEPTTAAQALAEEVTRIYYGLELDHWRLARAHLTKVVVRVFSPHIAELEAEIARLTAISVGEAYAYRSEDHGRSKKP